MRPSTNNKHHTIRLFLALVPGEYVKPDLARHRDQWRWAGKESQFAPADWHVTLHFLGSVASNRLDELRAGLNVPFQPFDLDFGQPELWAHGLSVLCPVVVPAALRQLHVALGDVLQQLGLKTDSRPYRPHVTLARHAQGALLPVEPVGFIWPVVGYALMESTGDVPLRYRVVQRYGAAL